MPGFSFPVGDYNNTNTASPISLPSPSSQATRFFVADHLGTAVMELSSGGWPVYAGQFAPFGQELQPNGSLLPTDAADGSSSHYKFTGKERDAESGLDYFGARYYASNMGRFMSPDWAAKPEAVPYSSLPDPQSLNLYAYVRNNPLDKIDADGHDTSGTEKYGSGGADGFWNDPDRNSTTAARINFLSGYINPPGSSAQQQNLTATPVKHPSVAATEVQFHLSQKSKQGGWIVQQIIVSSPNTDKAFTYWEAWYVDKGSKDTSVNLNGGEYDDLFRGAPKVSFTASARFYEGLQLDQSAPNGFITDHPKNWPAGILPSTSHDPHLPTDNATAPLNRTYTVP